MWENEIFTRNASRIPIFAHEFAGDPPKFGTNPGKKPENFTKLWYNKRQTGKGGLSMDGKEYGKLRLLAVLRLLLEESDAQHPLSMAAFCERLARAFRRSARPSAATCGRSYFRGCRSGMPANPKTATFWSRARLPPPKCACCSTPPRTPRF